MCEDTVMDIQTMSNYNNAVEVHQASKTYGSKKDGFPVLKGLNLTVPRGTIYGLLGPSGCGKTTLLRCIVGRLSIDSGRITVFGEAPSTQVSKGTRPRIGFMPQEITLCSQLSLDETIWFYGKIAGMSKEKISASRTFLLDFLNIGGATKKLIGNLSGGQKRRVSMAIALLHEPELLVLDEPTVGVDPVLRASIWEYLNKMVNLKDKPVTIIITTHYIEEASLANNIGMMLHGRLLAQSSPGRLMQKYDCASLEDVFLKLCLDNQNNNPDSEMGDDGLCSDGQAATGGKNLKAFKENAAICDTSPLPRRNATCLPRWHRIEAFFWKDLKFFVRHIGMLILEMMLPSLVIILFSISVGKSLYGMPVGIVNEDMADLGQNFIDSINKDIVSQVQYTDYAEAEQDAKVGKILGIVHLSQNFSDSILYRFHHGALTIDSAYDEGMISIRLDWTSQQSAYAISSELITGYTKFMGNILKDIGLNPAASNLPVKFADIQVYGSSDGNFDQFLFPGFFLCCTFFLAMGLTAISVNTERLSGTLERVLLTGAQVTEYMLGHMLAHLVLMVAQTAGIFVVAFAIYRFTCQGSYFLVAALAIVQGICGMYLGFAVSMAFASEAMMIMFCLALWFVAIVSEGFLWPLECMPYAQRLITEMLPQTSAVGAIRSIMNRGWGLGYTQVIGGFTMSLTWIVLFACCGIFISRRTLK